MGNAGIFIWDKTTLEVMLRNGGLGANDEKKGLPLSIAAFLLHYWKNFFVYDNLIL